MLRVRYGPTYAAERRYAVDLLLGEFLGLDVVHEIAPVDGFELTLSEDPESGRVLVTDGFFRLDEEDRLTEAALPARPVEVWDTTSTEIEALLVEPQIPVLYGEPAYQFLETSETEVRLGVDIFGSAFFMLARLEEVVSSKRDQHGRFPAGESIATAAGFLERPIVNEYLEILWWSLKRVWPQLERRRRTFRLLPTHDVDFPFCSTTSVRRLGRQTALDLARRRDPLLAAARLWSYAATAHRGSAADLCNTFDFIMRTSERQDCISAFYFMTGRTDPRFDGDYSIDDPDVRALLREIASRGHEIGVHPSYGTYLDVDRTRTEFESLLRACAEEGIAQPAWGGRQHFLRWDPSTWVAWEQSGLNYDSTLSFPQAAGFRCGVCYEYPAFDLQKRQALRLRERPLIVMDASLTDYAQLTQQESVEHARLLRERCRQFDGDFTFLFHNNRLVRRSERRAYEALFE